MKVLQLHNKYIYPGGEDAVAQSEARMLEACGDKVIVFSKDNKDLAGARGLKYVLKDALFSRDIYKEVRVLIERERPDVAHVHNSFFYIGPAAYEACFDAGVPVVQTLHNYRFLCAAATFYRDGHVCEECLQAGKWKGVWHACWRGSRALTLLLTRVIKAYTTRNILKRIKTFIVLSEFSRKKFIQGGFDPQKLSVKPNFLDEDPGAVSFQGDYVLYVGALAPYKGVMTLLRAWKGGSWSLPLKVAGSGELAGVVAKEAGAGVEILGQKTQAEIMELIKGALCVVIPSECYENFPRVIIEAYACGVPVVASRLGALEELVQDGRTGLLFEPGDAQALADALGRLVQGPALAKTMGQNARMLFEQKYQMKANYGQLSNIYQTAVRN